jgi:hypothetical protein
MLLEQIGIIAEDCIFSCIILPNIYNSPNCNICRTLSLGTGDWCKFACLEVIEHAWLPHMITLVHLDLGNIKKRMEDILL